MFITRSQIVSGFVILCCVSAAWAQPEPPPGGIPGGGPPDGFPPFGLPQPGEILPGFLQDQLKLTVEQKKQLGQMQKDVEANLTKLLSAEQKKSLDKIRQGKGGFGFGPPGFGPPGGMPGFGPPKGGFGPTSVFGGGTEGIREVQKKIGSTDEEWKVIGPKLQKVMAARRAVNGDAGPMGGPFGGGPMSNIVAQAQADLKAVLDEPKHTKADVEEKLTAIRKAREKARADLEEAQRDLTRLLTPTQQTIMVSLGHLD